jgi:hypothetical protein
MQAESIVDALERFFLDIVGTVIPGGAALLAAPVLFGGSINIGPVSLTPSAATFNWLVFVLASYAAGHAVNSFGEKVVTKVLEHVVPKLNKRMKGTRMKWLAPEFIESEMALAEQISQSAPFKALQSQVKSRYGWEPATGTDVKRLTRDLRNVAMTIAKDDRPTVYRFRFLSLLNLGLATVLLLGVFLRVVTSMLHGVGLTVSGGGANWWLLSALVALSGFFLERRYMLYGTSQRVPFSMAMGQLLLSSTEDVKKENGAAAKKP